MSIRSTLWLAIAVTIASTILGASALHGYQLYRQTQAAESLRSRALAEAYATQAARWLGSSREELHQQLRQLAWHPDVCMLAVVLPTEPNGGRVESAPVTGLTQSSKIIAIRGDERLLRHFLASPAGQGGGVDHLAITPPGKTRGASAEVYLASAGVRLPGSTRAVALMVCGVRSASRHALPPREIVIFFVRLLVAAVATGVTGVWWLRRSVVMPLATLADRSSSIGSGQASPLLHSDRDDEIGTLARTLSDMHISLDEWRDRAVRLERSVNRRVATETERVARELQQAKRTIWTDSLTQLGNRRMLEDRFEEIFAAQRRNEDDLSVVMIDVDNFKQLNDTKGHAAGDELLRFIGELLKQSLREQDLAIRYGGDEFILLLPSVTLQDAQRIAERTILLFNQQAKLLSIQPKPSMSAGIASIWEHKPQGAQQLLEMADAALYEAKRAGKSCVRCSPRPRSASARPVLAGR